MSPQRLATRHAAHRYPERVLPYNIHHVAIAVPDLDATLGDLQRLFGVDASSREVVEGQGVEEAMIAIGGSYIQLLEPLAPDTTVGRFLERRGQGMHHVALAVPNIDAALEHLVEQGAELIDETPRIGGGGHRIAFVHPRSTSGTLIELVEVTHG